MEPTMLAASAVSLLVPYLARIGGQVADRIGGDLGQAVVDQLCQLYERIRTKVVGDRFAEPALERFAQRPTNKVQRSSFAFELSELLERDPSFAAELATLVSKAKQTAGPTLTQVTDAGALAIHGDLHMEGTYVAGRDMFIGDQER
jgi:hypothetical protein